MARGKDFKMRLLDEEVADLDARAARDGLAKADVIRKAMGWAPVNLLKPSSPATGDTNGAHRPPKSSPSSEEPGVAAASELARRIAERRQKG
jgi:hypothetical protein